MKEGLENTGFEIGGLRAQEAVAPCKRTFYFCQTWVTDQRHDPGKMNTGRM